MEILLNTDTKVFIKINGRLKVADFNSKLNTVVKLPIDGDDDLDERKISDNNPYKKLYLFIHTKDYEGSSKTHFEVNYNELLNRFFMTLCNVDKIAECELEKNFYINKNTFNVQICWYKHELRSCTVYKPLQEVKNKYYDAYKAGKLTETEKKQYEKELIEIFDMHDRKKRHEHRKNIMELYKKEELTKRDKDSINEAKKKHI